MVAAAIQAVANLQEELPIHLAIVGGGVHKPLVHAAAQLANASVNRDVIKVVGQKLNPVECYQSADVVIGTARVALEALSCQKPVIAGGNASYVGYLEPDNLSKAWNVYFGDHHWAFPLTVDKLMDDLRYVFDNKRVVAQNSARLRDWIIANFDIKDIAQKTL